MSITVSTGVFCDGDGCLAWTGGVTGGRSDAQGARRVARSHGWVRRHGRDLCPDCAASESTR